MESSNTELDIFNLEESLHFYVDLVGFHVVYDREEDKFVFLQFENVQLMIQQIDMDMVSQIVDIAIIEGVETKGIGLAIMNRLIRACEHDYIEV